ncbi:MAG TPA: hemolysin III family protein, partial [Gammaproteobacteria bacterium]|nr:hemolysin III family protein [Gammaproteobacteria bacterium]
GFLILSIIWLLALAGILSEVLLSGRAVKFGQMLIYLGMGWACSFDFASLRAELPGAGLWWLTAGGIAYTGGVVFYILDKMNRLNHAHGIWHLFVLAGSSCHFVSVIGYVR